MGYVFDQLSGRLNRGRVGAHGRRLGPRVRAIHAGRRGRIGRAPIFRGATRFAAFLPPPTFYLGMLAAVFGTAARSTLAVRRLPADQFALAFGIAAKSLVVASFGHEELRERRGTDALIWGIIGSACNALDERRSIMRLVSVSLPWGVD